MSGRLIVISNRIPTEQEPSGGLVVALHECLSQRGGTWIGTSCDPTTTPRDGLVEIARDAYSRLAFDLTPQEHETYYLGYANSVLWPLFHRRADLMQVEPGFFEGYARVNARLAAMIAEYIQPDDAIWIHDYHFLPLAFDLRALGVTKRIGFFLHIPFPVASDVPALPQAHALLDWIAAYDIFGLQTEADVNRCAITFQQAGARREGKKIAYGKRVVQPLACPIGIDAALYRATAETSKAAERLHIREGQKLIIGVDRLDYSKGLVQRFEGFGDYLAHRSKKDPEATFLQIAPTSREDVEAYQDVRQALDLTAGSINGAHGEIDWTPIRYIRRHVQREDLAGLYRRADVAMVTPLADGMNLVAKEFVAAQDAEDPGVLILSRFAGAAEQLPKALIINPYDTREIADALKQALGMPLEERRMRHAALWENVSQQDIGWWTRRFLGALTQNDLASVA